ncbi:unnamed protein product, partial [Haemonchus placei]|uniref:Oligoendopeptidase F n=1 Tax=Haemonchus placei TaxID=6290 RepID=A0A0N4WFW1_HAEPC
MGRFIIGWDLSIQEMENRANTDKYILDTEPAAQERLGDVRNSECEPGLMRYLSGLLASVNVYAQSYKMMHEVEQM